MSSNEWPRIIGNMTEPAGLLAERAVEIADAESSTSKAKFAIFADSGNRARMDRVNRDTDYRFNTDQHVATFTRKADPDWLASEIRFQRTS